MSIRTMNRIWDTQTSPGTHRLLLMALADRADEDGICWPGVDYLSSKVQVKVRQVQKMLRDLESTGELFVQINRGRGRTNQYFVTVGLPDDEFLRILQKRLKYSADDALKILSGLIEKRLVEKGASQDTFSETDQKGASENTFSGEDEKGVPDDTFLENEKDAPQDTFSDEKGAFSGQKVNSRTPNPLTIRHLLKT
jgi:hypothetical protein